MNFCSKRYISAFNIVLDINLNNMKQPEKPTHRLAVATILCLLAACTHSAHKPVVGVLNPQTHHTKIFDKPDGAIIDSIANNMDKDEFYWMDILESKNGWFLVDACLCLPHADSVSHKGWVRYPNVGIYMRDLREVKIYDSPSYDSSVKLKLHYAEWGPYAVIDIEGEWLCIELDYEGETTTGWLSPHNQDCNPYTIEC